ncbi:MAG: hypothetical protein NTV34_12560 [Proteobacteria bacterium]|nr:hypothetical protein [Pseudomonadota bacterium]
MVRHTGGVNAASRYAQSMGMIVNHSFSIDGFETMTPDISITPDGRYYSNKAPGPSFLGLPVAWAIDRVFVDQNADPEKKYQERFKIWSISEGNQAFLFQVIPCIFLVFLLDRLLAKWQISETGRGLAILGVLFGSTPAFLQNTMFGHGMAASAVLAAVLCVFDGRLILSGLLFGIALLADYGSAAVLPGLVWIWLKSGKGNLKSKIIEVGLGATLPALVWIWYHVASFGSPFVTAQKFLDPQWERLPQAESALWGLFSSKIDVQVAWNLLFSRGRGLLFTQPWILVSAVCGLFYLPSMKRLRLPAVDIAIVTYSSFLILWLTNASFNGWHGGATIGPRYLSPCLYLFAIWAAFLFDASAPWLRNTLILSSSFAVVYFGFGFPQDILTGPDPWVELWNEFIARSFGMQLKVFAVFSLVCLCGYYYLSRGSKTALFPWWSLKSAPNSPKGIEKKTGNIDG